MRIIWFGRSLFAVAITALCAFVLSSCSSGAHPSFVPGETAPDFAIRDVNGKEQSLEAYKGKVILLNFWATWCGPCVGELPSLERLTKKLGAKDFVVLGVAVDDDRDSVENFKKVYGLTYPTGVDTTGSVKRTYKLTGVPESFFIDKEGKFVLMADPQTNDPVVRIIGPRDWDTPNMISRISALLRN